MTDESQNAQVGRNDIAVDDPLNRLRPYLDTDTARMIDRDATVLGVEYAGLDDRRLTAFREEAGKTLERVPPWAPTESWREWTAGDLSIEEGLLTPEADWLVDERTSPTEDPERHREALIAELNRYSKDFALRESPQGLDNAVRWVAAARELAIRREEAIELGTGSKPDPSRPLREIGSGVDVSALIAERQYERDYAKPSSYERGLVNPTLTVQRLEGVVPGDQLKLLSERTEPLRMWVQHQPSWWIRDRHRELGQADKSMDRATAREMTRIGTAIAAAQTQRDAALHEAERYVETDSGRAHVQRESAETLEQRIDGLSKQRDGAAGRDNGPEQWASAPETALATAYADEYGVRHAIATERAVQRSIANPPAELLQRIGPRPHQAVLGQQQLEQRQAWDHVAGELERERLGRNYAERDGIDPPQPRSATAEQELQTQIDALREQQGMPPEQQLEAAQREISG